MKITYSLYIALLLAIIGLTFPTLVLASTEHTFSTDTLNTWFITPTK